MNELNLCRYSPLYSRQARIQSIKTSLGLVRIAMVHKLQLYEKPCQYTHRWYKSYFSFKIPYQQIYKEGITYVYVHVCVCIYNNNNFDRFLETCAALLDAVYFGWKEC